ncbi:MAG: YdbH domain-containing protein, partial [Methylococcaceae bacterium]|nr:YdbH domain-containing protein [Methylococcaceae bacterium]
DIPTINFQHLSTGTLNGSAHLNYKQELSLEHAQFTLRSDELQKLTSIYLQPFFAQSFLSSLTFAGHIDASFTMTGLSLSTLSASVNQLAITDSAKRIKLQNGFGTINWSANETFNQPSQFAWQQLHVYELPIGATQLKFLTNAGNIQLLGNTKLPFLGGDIRIQQFKLQTNAKDAAKVAFQGDVNQVSLQQLSATLKWQPLIGTLSGSIPQVNYSDKKLTLNGEFLIKVFGGSIKITKLAAANLFNALPTFYGDIDIDWLDLEQLTSKYEFGNITGKLSGFVNQLQIEDGQPIGFLAWIGSPDNDDTPHRISQKAVNNIAHIGGSGTSDLVSRSFLKLFDTFGYDKIGLGCYLHDGVCQLSGVTATDAGYTIVLGGGVPRIDVIGYNTRVDWAVLMERLARISTSDKVIVQ